MALDHGHLDDASHRCWTGRDAGTVARFCRPEDMVICLDRLCHTLSTNYYDVQFLQFWGQRGTLLSSYELLSAR